MRQSQLFTRTIREAPRDEESRNAQLLTRAGFIYKNSAGVYSFLPLGWRVMQKIAVVIREEMNAIGGQEIFMPALHDKHYLSATGRWDVDVIFKVVESETAKPTFNISWTHEEIAAEIATKYVSSYNDLPFSFYQIQTKFRNEPRAKSGLLRGREFIMKDLYSFHADEKDLSKFYEQARGAYDKIFKRLGLNAIYTLAAGGDFTAENTNEFQVVAPVGEDTIFYCDQCSYSENQEISKLKAGDKCPKCKGKILQASSIEVGNIFPLGTKYAKAFNLYFTDKNGKKQLVVMGSYGIGLSRVMATIVELFNDGRGIIWPETVAPFKVHLLALGDDSAVKNKAAKIYDQLRQEGLEVLFDDRSEINAGVKFADADLIGIPWRLVVSEKTQDQVEVKNRAEEKIELMSLAAAIKKLKQDVQ